MYQALNGFKNQDSLNFEELMSCDIKVAINLENGSKNFSPPVLKALEQIESIKMENKIKFFVPRQFRTTEDEEENFEKSAILAKDLEDWVDAYFGHLLVPGYNEKVVQHAMSHFFWLCPFHPVDTWQFKTLCYIGIVGAIMDDWTDSDKTINYEEEGFEKDTNDTRYKSRMDVVEYLTTFLEIMLVDVGDTKDTKGDDSENKETCIMELLNKEPIVAAIFDAFTDIYDTIKTFQPHLLQKDCFDAVRSKGIFGMQGFQWTFDKAGKKNADEYSVETCRFFRQIESGMDFSTSVIQLIDGCGIPHEVKIHPVFVKWSDLSTKMFGIQNDVLGFQKDVRLGEEDGILMQKIRRGLSVKDALDEEMKLLSEFTSDYVKLRRILLLKFKDNSVNKYIDISDSLLYGYFMTFSTSLKYGMKGQIEIIHREKSF